MSLNYVYFDGNGNAFIVPSSSVTLHSNGNWYDNLGHQVQPQDGIVTGTAGNDVMLPGYVDANGDRIDGNDAILPGMVGNDDLIVAGAGNDSVNAGYGNDLVYGGAGADTLLGGAGNDTIYGDTAYVSGGGGGTGGGGTSGGNTDGGNTDGGNTDGGNTDGGNTDGGNTDGGNTDGGNTDGGDQGGGSAGGGSAGGGSAGGGTGGSAISYDDLIYGGDGNDVVYGELGNDKLYGGNGNDLVYGGVGNDTVSGDAGNDTLYGDAGNDSLDGGTGDDSVHGGDGNDSVAGGDGNDTLFGDAGNDHLDGGAGNDVLYGGDGADTMDGGTGNDSFYAGTSGADSLSGGDGGDSFFGGHAGENVDGGEGGIDHDTLDLTGAGPLHIIYDPSNPENGTVQFLDPTDHHVTGTMTFQNIENVIPCFTPGTLIATPRGEVPVEQLRVGDRIITRDNGMQAIRWVGRRDLSWGDLAAAPHLKPVLVRQGSLGNGLPEVDMMVSPNHRLLVANDRTALYFDEHEVLVAAKHLITAKGVQSVDAAGVSYIHFMCDRHEVVLSNGAWSESFQPGDLTLKGMGNAQRSEIYDIFPELKTPVGLENYSAARKTLKRHEAALLVR